MNVSVPQESGELNLTLQSFKHGQMLQLIVFQIGELLQISLLHFY